MSDSVATVVRQRSDEQNLGLAGDQIDRLVTFFELLRRWNRATNLTSLPLEDVAPSVEKLLIEPLIGAAMLRPTLSGAWIDIGSGGGSPAIPVRIVKDGLQLTMVEARTKKAAFLREAARTLGFEDVSVAAGRVEELEFRSAGSTQLITSRAVKLERSLADAIGQLLAPHGQFLSFGHQFEAPLPNLAIRSIANGHVLFEREG